MLIVSLLIAEDFVTFETRNSLPIEHMSLQIVFLSKRLIANWASKLLMNVYTGMIKRKGVLFVLTSLLSAFKREKNMHSLDKRLRVISSIF